MTKVIWRDEAHPKGEPWCEVQVVADRMYDGLPLYTVRWRERFDMFWFRGKWQTLYPHRSASEARKRAKKLVADLWVPL